jgi:NAD+ kinase
MRKTKRAGIVVKPHARDVDRILKDLLEYFAKRRIDCILEDVAARKLGSGNGLPREEIPASSDLVIVLGGDGTLLSVAHVAARAGVPVMGVNLGRLGFLTEIRVDEMAATLDAYLDGERDIISPRWMFEVETDNGASYCLNDVVVNKGALARMIEFTITIDVQEIATLKADGLIVSTPTGSTAYSLAAGGPILHPWVPAAVITPICPHTLTFRPLIVSSGSKIKIKLLTGGEEVYLTLDGQRGGILVKNDEVVIRRASNDLLLVVSPRRNFFNLVKEKLGWAG